MFFPAHRQTAKPNILVILTDDQGYHDVSYYGTKDIRTPIMDKIARAGMRFDSTPTARSAPLPVPRYSRDATRIMWAFQV